MYVLSRKHSSSINPNHVYTKHSSREALEQEVKENIAQGYTNFEAYRLESKLDFKLVSENFKGPI